MPRAGLTTDAVVGAGVEIADEAGFDAVTLSAVAARFGVRTPSLYTHVAGAPDLRARIAAFALDELADLATDALAGRSGKDALVAFADAYRDYAREHPGRFAATTLRVDPDSPAVAAGRRHADLTRALLRGYDLDEADQTHAIRLLGSVLHGYATLEIAGGFDHSTPPSTESWPRILDALDAALHGWSGH